MHRTAAIKSILFKGASSFFESAQIIDSLRYVKSQKTIEAIARGAIELARDGWMLRRTEFCNWASSLVLGLDVSPKLQAVAEYYRSLSEPERDGGAEPSRRALIQAADRCLSEHFPRIILVLGRSHHNAGDHREALRYYLEAWKSARDHDALTQMSALWNVAMVDYDRGCYADALRRFEGLFPVVRALSHRYPVHYYDYLNNLAGLLSQNGRTEESRHAIEIALASPFADRFPEWRETQKEIEEAAQKEPRRSPATVTVVPALRARPREAPARVLGKPPKTFVIVVVRLDQVGGIAPFRPASVRALASLLERYVKTVRIRDSP
jgi:tetratricopeptide (TPR) repeat protein